MPGYAWYDVAGVNNDLGRRTGGLLASSVDRPNRPVKLLNQNFRLNIFYAAMDYKISSLVFI